MSEKGFKAKENIFKLVKRINKDSKNVDNYHTGLLGEQIIVSAYNQMPLEKLIKLRFIMNKIINKKKEFKRINESKKKDDENKNAQR